MLAKHRHICAVQFRNCPKVSNASVLATIQNQWIRWLDFGGPAITDEIANYFERMQHVIKLNLSRTEVTGRSVEMFASLKGLRTLRLVGCRISKVEIERVKELLPNCKVLS